MSDESNQIKTLYDSGVINLHRLDKFPKSAPKEFKELEELWPTPAEIWNPIPYTSKDVATLNSQDAEVGEILREWTRSPSESLKFNGDFNQPANVGRWLPLDVAFNWAQKRGSGQPSKLDADLTDFTDEYPEDVKSYNDNMHPYLKSYLIEDSANNANVIYLATSFKTERSTYYPVFIRFMFNQDNKEWIKSAVARHKKHNDDISNDPYYIDLKAYVSGRSKKIGLFTNADRVDLMGYNVFKTNLSHPTWSGETGSLWSHLLNQTYPQALSEHSSSYSNAYEALTDNINYKQFEGGMTSRKADKAHKPYWTEWASGKTLTNKKNRNQIYIWIPARKEKYFNPANQLGLFNWSSAFWERKD
tara:strand:+ start:5171 stop:6250 length:1080 start_codon:yes stop_codon:yes gene_type:complete